MKQQDKEKLFTARVPTKLYEDFKEATRLKDETASEAFRQFIRQYVKQANKTAQRAQA